jgi:hypothetical protein
VASHGKKRKSTKRGRHLPPSRGTPTQEAEAWLLNGEPQEPLFVSGSQFWGSGVDVAAGRPLRRALRRIVLGFFLLWKKLRRSPSSN